MIVCEDGPGYTLLTAVYVLADDHMIPSGRPRHGRPVKLSNAELLGVRSEHHYRRWPPDLQGNLLPDHVVPS
jgi:hypothetical protein